MSNIGKYILRTGEVTDTCTEQEEALGVVFEEDENEYRFLALSDTECSRSYTLKEIIDIVQSYNQEHGNSYLRWSVPSLRDWNSVLRRLAKAEIIGRELLSAGGDMEEWTEFDSAAAIGVLKKYNLLPDISCWSSSEGNHGDVYFLCLEAGTIEAYPVWDDGEPYDYALRLVGHVDRDGIHGV